MVFFRKKHRSIQKRFSFLLLAALFPIIFIQGYIYYDRFATRRAEELQANIELARAVGVAFNALVQDVIHHELAIAIAATATPPLSAPDLTRLLEQSSKEISGIRFHWLGPSGRILASSDPQVIDVDFSDRTLFKEIASGRLWYVSNLTVAELTVEPAITITRGIRDAAGKLLGLVVAAVDLDRLKTVLAFERSKDAGVSLVDRNGIHVIRHPDTEYTLEQKNWLKLFPQIEHALRGEEFAATVTSALTGKKRLVGFVPIPSIGWVAASSRAQDDVTSDILSDLVTHGTMFLLVTLAAFGMAFTLSRSLATSVAKFRDHVRALGRGETGDPAVASGSSELEELADAFNEMAGEVRKREEALRDRENRLRAIFESTEEAIITLDGELRCLEANPAAGTITGVPHDQLVGRLLREFIDSDYDLSSAWAGFLKEGRFRGEVRIRHSSGSQRVVEASGVAHIGPGRHLFVGHDITERKQMEEELRRTHDDLEERVRNRTAELERRNQELQDFTFAASHDLQEPLRKIQTFGDLVAAKYGDSIGKEGYGYIRRMQKTAALMQEILQSLLKYSRLTSKAESFAPVDLNEIAREIVSDFEIEIRDSGAIVEIGNLPEIEADAGHMRQLFQNLLGNALKFRREGELPKVRIHSDCKEDGISTSGECWIYAEDNGIGFEEKYLERIFKPFQRLHGREEYGGIGMGLAICAKVAEIHKGRITVKSTPGKGSTFIVTLPRKQRVK